jgi:menaquinone-dependent protoporphyrinogen oxidase
MTDARLLVLHAGKYGQTRKVAERIADRLRATGATVDTVDVRAAPPADLDGYDGLVIGGAVHAGNHLRALERWMRAHATAINARPTAVFSVSLSASDVGGPGHADATKHLDELLSRTEVEARRRTVIAGALAYRSYGPLIRWTMRRLARRKGLPADTGSDVELTDWDAVDRFSALLVDTFDLGAPTG